MKKEKTIFIGPVGGGKVPTNGASIKNYHILGKLKEIPNLNLKVIDTEFWKKSPKVLCDLLFTILNNRRAKFILSLNNDSANKMIRILNSLAPKASVIYWVIGGSIGKWIMDKKVDAAPYKNLDNIIVEGETMKRQFIESGLNKVSVMPNFKFPINIKLPHKEISTPVKFVFLSRIIPEKGCNLILDASEKLNKNGFSDKYLIDFYGPIESGYNNEFLSRIKSLNNVTYKGFLDLRKTENYNILASYDAMLFPTYWPGEGCPGIVIDALMAGVPIMASRWNLNSDYIIDNVTGILFEPKSCEALIETMKKCISGEINLVEMSSEALKKGSVYDINNVLSIKNLIDNGIITHNACN